MQIDDCVARAISLACVMYAGVMHQVKKLCEPDVIDLSAKKTETAASVAAASAGDVTENEVFSAPGSAAAADKRPSNATAASVAGTHADASRQSGTVAPSASSPRM